jgi:cellulose synthase/poly-beta-1,6-N-acetylglucosamine synthase-like glycosyltransferase
MSLWQILYYVFVYGFFLYSVIILSFYIFLGIYAIGEIRAYFRKRSFSNYKILATSELAPSLSILAPAYNEEATIVENVRSLLSIYYNNFEVIIINDGSKDYTLQKLIPVYDLKKVPYYYQRAIATKPIRGIYKSSNPVYKNLIVVDKINGGKADALNVGINVSQNNYVVCIDVDCILEQDAMIKISKPFLENNEGRVIATGGVVRIANSCEIKDGKITKVNLPTDFLARMQTLEYMRTFILGRMAWSRMDGLLLISGAFGAFDKEIVIKAGGYDHNTVGEDMELVVRMRLYMEDRKLLYKVAYIPDPLCWTEAPESFKILGLQRNRWTRGTIETLRKHKKMFLNRKYGVLGFVSYPYWLFFEFFAPVIEFVGFICFIIFTFLGIIDWSWFFALLLFLYSFAILFSTFAILMEVLTYNQYGKRKDIFNLIGTALLEPLIFHPFTVWAAIKGNIDLLRKKKTWGEMSRKGFNAKVAP